METHEEPVDLEDALLLLCRVHFRYGTFDEENEIPIIEMGAAPGFHTGVNTDDYLRAWYSVRRHILNRRRFFEATHRLTDVTGLTDGSPVIPQLIKQSEKDPMVRILLDAFRRSPQSPRAIVELALNAVLHFSMLNSNLMEYTAATIQPIIVPNPDKDGQP